MAKKMQIKKGIPVSPGYKVRKALILEDEEYLITRRFLTDKDEVEGEIKKFRDAVEEAKSEIDDLKNEANSYLSEDSLQIFSAHQMLLSDPKIHESVIKRIRHNHFTAEYAVSRTMKAYVKKFESSSNEFFASRAKDLRDIENRLIRILLKRKKKSQEELTEELIVIAKDLTPSQTASFDRRYIVGFATDSGGKTSHTAIVARAFGIPAVVGVGSISEQITSEDTVVIDGVKGLVVINPDEPTLEKYRTLEREFDAYGEQLHVELKDLPCETIDGHEISLWANIEVPEEVEIAVQNGANGVGLFRTEFLYAKYNEIPDEETHFQAYRKAIRLLEHRPIVIRLLDLGADKFYHRMGNLQEKNPFLGCRSIRYLFQEFDILKAQFRAILRASAIGKVKILIPMISSIEELRKARNILEDTKEELAARNIEFDRDIQVGIMLEVPSAVIIADILAKEVDFFSIGTNDLVQYTLAVDRINERVASLYQPAHPAIIRMLKKVIEIGKKRNTPVSICGEMSGEVRYIIPLLGLGLKSLSVTPAVIPQIKKVIRSTTLRETRAITRRLFDFDEPQDSEEYLQEQVMKMVPGLFHNFS